MRHAHRFIALAAYALALSSTSAMADVITQIILPAQPGFGIQLESERQDPRLLSDQLARPAGDPVGTARGTASADLGTGVLSGTATAGTQAGFAILGGARAYSRVQDVLTVIDPLGGTTPVEVQFQLVIDGDLVVPNSSPSSASAFGTVSAAITANDFGSVGVLTRQRVYDVGGAVISDGLTESRGWDAVTPSGNHYDLLLLVRASVIPGMPFDFRSELTVTAGNTGLVNGQESADFGNTARISVVLPQGTSLASQSGFFLAGPVSVTEPTTLALLTAGLGLAGWRRRGRRAR